MRCLGRAIVIIALLAMAAVGGNFLYGWWADGPLEEERTVIIEPGTSLKQAAAELEQEGVLFASPAFLTRARIFGGSEPIKAGEFLFPPHVSNLEVLEILQGGIGKQRLITVPEGMPSVLVHEELMGQTLLTGDVPVPPEGSVLPESYSFDRGEPRGDVLMRMQTAMQETLAELWPKRSQSTIVTTPEEAVILASIVEKETAVESERRTVAAVYSNRLKKGMMLQADPTTIYPITKGKPLGRRILRSELSDVNDYNTYAMVGLPRGPITNPGRASIEAVLNPADSDALYFVADGKGGHIFAKTLEEHNKNVERWYSIRRERGEM